MSERTSERSDSSLRARLRAAGITDADALRHLELVGELGRPRSQGTVQEARVRRRVVGWVSPTYRVGVQDVDLPTTPIVRARVYRPLDVPPAATMVYLHGGGWVLGDLDINDDVCRYLAERAGVVVLSVDYPLAPEHPFPAAVDGAEQVCDLVGSGRSGVAGLPRGLVVGGLSAGGALAAAVAARSARGEGPRVLAQVLLCPVLDSDLDRDSYRRYGDGPTLTAEDMRWFWSLYDPDGSARLTARAAPLRAASVSGSPPTLLVVAGVDPLRDEAMAYAEALRAASVPVTVSLVEGVMHGFVAVPWIRSGRRALADVADGLAQYVRGCG